MGGELLEEVLWGQLACRSAASAGNLHAELRNKGLNSPSYCAKRHVSVLLRIVVEGWRAARSRSWGEAAAAPLLSVGDDAVWCSGTAGTARAAAGRRERTQFFSKTDHLPAHPSKCSALPGHSRRCGACCVHRHGTMQTTRGEQSKPNRNPRCGWPPRDVRNQREGTHHELGLVFIRYGRSG